MILKTKYLEFKEVPFKGKTKRFEVLSYSTGEILGRIQWYSHWRQYTFMPSYPTVWNKDCLNDISKFLEDLMIKRNNIKLNTKINGDIIHKPLPLDCQGLNLDSKKGKIS